MFLYSLIIISLVFLILENSFFQVSFNLKVILYMKKRIVITLLLRGDFTKQIALTKGCSIFSNLFGFLFENMNDIYELILSHNTKS